MTDADAFRRLMSERIDTIDFDAAREDVRPFIANPGELGVWSRDYFKAVVSALPVEDEEG